MTLTQVIFGEIPLYPYWVGLFIFFALGASLYQYKFKVKRGLKAANGTPNTFSLCVYMKDWQNHYDFAMMVVAGFAILRFANYALGTEATVENIEILLGCSFALGAIGQKGIDKLFQLVEKLLGKGDKTDKE